MSATSFNPDIIAISKQLIEYTEAIAPTIPIPPQAGSPITKAALQRIDRSDRSLKPLLERVQQIAPANVELSKAIKACEEAPTFDNVRYVTALCMRQCPDDMIARFLGLHAWVLSESEKVEVHYLEEACQKIIQCFKEQEEALSLGGFQLTSLPTEPFYYLPWLKKLVASSNELTTLPNEIGLCTELEYMMLSSNQITSLPESIGECKNLQVLYASNNKLTYLPKSIGQCEKLDDLMLDTNQLTELPEEIGGLINLQSFYCTENLLERLPAGIGRLEGLQFFFCSENQLKKLPKEFGNCKSLQKFSCNKNQLERLPSTIGRLENLKNFNCNDNQLTEIPQELGQCKNLMFFTCNNNQLNSFPTTIGKLEKLGSLCLRGNQFTNLPLELTQCKNLKSLDCSFNPFRTLPQVISQLTSLTGLVCSETQLTDLPEELANLNKLQYLECNKNQIQILPSVVTRLANLQTLDFEGNRLTTLPQEMRQLENLENLYFAGNLLSELPHDIFDNWAKLDRIDFSNNQLTAIPASLGCCTKLNRIDFSNNQLTAIPASLGYCTKLKWLDLSNNSLSEIPNVELPALYHFNAQDNDLTDLPPRLGERFPLGRQKNSSYQRIAHLQKLATDETLKKLEFTALKTDEALLTSINDWIERLQQGADYQNEKIRPVVCNRVLALLHFAEENVEYRNTLIGALTDATGTCTDRASLRLINLELQKKIVEYGNSVPIILELLKGCFVIDELESFAKSFFYKNPSADEIEIHLGLQLKLKDRFNLPIDVQDMNFFASSNLTEQDLQEATQQVHEALNSKNKLLTYLTHHQLWPKWQEVLQKEYAAEYGQDVAEIHAAMQKLGEEKETIPSQEYVERSNSLRDAYSKANKRWAKKKTLEILQKNERSN